jgi:hypothetical protein
MNEILIKSEYFKQFKQYNGPFTNPKIKNDIILNINNKINDLKGIFIFQ